MAAPVHDSTTSSAAASFSHTCSGSDRYLKFTGGSDVRGDTISAVTYGGVALTQRVRRQHSGAGSFDGFEEYWDLINPASGANTLAVTTTAGGSRLFQVSSYTGVHQTTPTGTFAQADGVSTAPSVAVSSAAGELVVDGVLMATDPESLTTIFAPGASQTERGEFNPDGWVHGAVSDEEATGASTTMSWTSDSNDNWILIGVSLKPVDAGPPPPAITRTPLTSGQSTANASTYDTASVTLTAGRGYVMGVLSSDAAPETDPTGVATVGGAIAFVKRASTGFNTIASPVHRLSVWDVVAGSTVTAAIRVTLNDAGTGCAWVLYEIDGDFDATTLLGTPAVDQANAAASIAATVGALAETHSIQLAFGAHDLGTTTDVASGTGWSSVSGTVYATPASSLEWAENLGTSAQQATFSGAGTADRAIIVVEVRGATSSTLLVVQDAAHGHTSDSPALTQAHVLVVQDATHSHAADSPALSQANTLAAQDSTLDHTADSPSLSQGYALVVQDANQSQTADNVDLLYGPQLTVQDAAHGHTADSPVLTQSNVLAVADAAHGHSADSPALTQAYQLAVQDASHSQTADGPTLSQAYALAVQDAAHGHSADNVVVTFGLTLVVQDATHAHTADSPTPTVAFVLVVADSLHGHSAGSVVLVQAHVLAVDDALHGHTADSPTLFVGVLPDYLVLTLTIVQPLKLDLSIVQPLKLELSVEQPLVIDADVLAGV